MNVATGYISSHSIQGFAFRIVDFDFFLTPEGYDILICYHCSSSIYILHDCLQIFAFQRDVSFHDVDAGKFVWLALLVTIKVPINAMVFCLIEILNVFSRVDI